LKEVAGDIALALHSMEMEDTRKQAKEALQESEQRFRSLVETTSDWIWEVDEHGTYTYVSPKAKALLGYEPDEMIGKTPFDFMPPDEAQRIAREFSAIVKFRKPLKRLENLNIHKDGHAVVMETSGVPIIDTNGRLSGYRGIDRDITERKQAEQDLKESEKKYRTLVESSTDAILMLDKERNVVTCNQAFFNLFGYNKREIEGKSIRIIHQSDESFHSFGRTTYPVISRTDSFRTECEFMHKDGTIFPVETITSAIRSPDGSITGYNAIIRNITERRKAEEALRESEEKYRTLFEKTANPILIINAEGNYLDCNDAALQFLECTRDELLAKNVRHFIRPGQKKQVLENHKPLWESGGIRETEHYVNGKTKILELTITPAVWQGKRAVYGVGKDITERRKAEEEHKRLQSQLEHAQRMEAIGTLAGGIAHDFNNILSAVIGYTQLARENVPERSRTYSNLQEVLNAGIRAKDLVGQILSFSRQTEHEQKPVRISSLIKESLRLLRPSLPTTIEIRQNIQTESDTVLADPSQIHQVLVNLCTNAAHAMREKGGILEITLEELDLDPHEVASYPGLTPGPYVRLTVSDTGHGMNRRVMKRIFDPYFTTKERGVGTGLGLAIVDGIVKNHGGTITAYSKPEKGATFHVYLPRRQRGQTYTIDRSDGI